MKKKVMSVLLSTAMLAAVVILNLQPAARINYLKTSTGEWLAHCGACPVPELANAFNRAGITYRCINGLLDLYSDYMILLGHDGPFHLAIAQGKPLLRGLGVYHGKQGTGVSVEAKVCTGDITNLGCTQTVDGKLKFIITEAEAPTHHFAMSVGHNGKLFEKIFDLLNIPCVTLNK